uniref:Dihydrolipoyllysine-residue succinyltransferase component of 2-oxoglutarate dehydrogenase complex n=1 Tax=Candidatus Kentrum eta TaxID=2126337 RepID=A0A450V540_9GAMM|nr:MAG: 2-oxoglutarate dehydrogenase E2 component [Candidatus Kentron sp. H]VFJ91948.1 MAG: 2-oxoglutarate dehydrogenase E2 component [Candidatus Kentron sp. H]VFJ99796.1 MAG: 2-oxoglutarate dehydrogenase E2 component [Candidatus Kentron sp. H]
MIIDITVPTLPESVPDATLLEWKKAAGAPVTRDEILVELETDKVVLEVAAPQDGTLKEILKQGGQHVLANDVIAKLKTEPDTALSTDRADGVSEETAADTPLAALGPAVRKLVAEHRLDPETITRAITGTGRDGRLTKGDVLAWLENRQSSSAPTPSPDTRPVQASRDAIPPPDTVYAPETASPRTERRMPMSRIRARIAQRLIEAQQTAAILTTFNEANLQAVMDLRERFRTSFEAAHGVRLGVMSFFVKAAVQALRQFPIVNASLEGADIVYHDYYDIGIAVGSSRGLVVPILRDSDRLSFAEIETKITEFAQKANAAQLRIEDLSGGTFTITNGGIFGSLMSTPILNPPQSAILGMHKIQQRPVAEEGQIVIRPMMYLALGYDHRLIDGQDAVRFLVAVKEAVEDPSRLLLEV